MKVLKVSEDVHRRVKTAAAVNEMRAHQVADSLLRAALDKVESSKGLLQKIHAKHSK